MTKPPIRIATRGSALARWQAEWVGRLLQAAGAEVELIVIQTSGDRLSSISLTAMLVQGVFTREVQAAVLDGRADVAVHSLKDLPTDPTEGLLLAAVPERESVADVLVLPRVGPKAANVPPQDAATLLRELPRGARIGTGSLRRTAQLRRLRNDLSMEPVRGNVDTRLRKLDEGSYDGLVLAGAGLRRLGLADRIDGAFAPADMVPAVGQGAVGVECRLDDSPLRQRLQRIDDPATHRCVIAERALLSALRAGCQAPVGACATATASALTLTAVVLSPDGQQRLAALETMSGDVASLENAAALGLRVAENLLRQGAARLVALARGGATPG